MDAPPHTSMIQLASLVGGHVQNHSAGNALLEHKCGSQNGLACRDELQFLGIDGVDKQRRRIVRITGKLFPAPLVDSIRLKDYVLQKVRRELSGEPFCVVYFHTYAKKNKNCPGVLTLRRIYEAIPQEHRQRLEVVYFVHPDLFSRTVMGTVGRFFLSEGLYQKLQYIHRLEFLWYYVKKEEIEVPEFVHEHDRELENRPLMDYGIETDPVPLQGMPGMDFTYFTQPWDP